MKVINQSFKKDKFFMISFVIIIAHTVSLSVKKEESSLTFKTKSSLNIPKTNNNIIITGQIPQIEENSNVEYFQNFVIDFFRNSKGVLYKKKNDTSLQEDNFISKINNEILHIKGDIIKYAIVEKCTINTCSPLYGACLSEARCECHFPYVNLPNGKNSCDYKLSFQFTALILEMIFPVGFGHIYSNRFLIGGIKFLSLFLIPLVFLISFKNYFFNFDGINQIRIMNNLNNKKHINYFELLKNVLMIIYFTIFTIWYLYDFIIFSSNKHKDGFGFDLIPMNTRYKFLN